MDNLVDQLIRDEEFIPYAYTDSLGWWTIGIGRLIDVRKGGHISEDEARYLLANDITAVTTLLEQYLPWTTKLDRVRFGVLQAMTFNMGFENLIRFHRTLTFIEDGDYEAASIAMLNSLWATEVGDRAQRLALQMKIGIWQ